MVGLCFDFGIALTLNWYQPRFQYVVACSAIVASFYLSGQTPDVAVTTIYNYLGQELITTTDNVINLPTAGVYVVMVNYNGYIVKQTIVKE